MSYKKGDICICIVDEAGKSRPVLFWDDWEKAGDRPTALVIPFTSVTSKSRYKPTITIKKNTLNNLTEDSILKLYQFGCVSKDVLGRVIGKLSDTEQKEINKLLTDAFPFSDNLSSAPAILEAEVKTNQKEDNKE